MPADEFMNSPCHLVQISDFLRAASFQIEADGPDAGPVKNEQLVVRNGGRQLGHADKAIAKLPQRVEQIGLVEGLEGAGYHGAADKTVAVHSIDIVSAGEFIRDVSLVGHHRKPRVDDVQMRIEEFEFS